MLSISTNALSSPELVALRKSLSKKPSLISFDWSPTPVPDPSSKIEPVSKPIPHDLWDFLPGDPKNLAYILSVYTLNQDYSHYRIDPKIFDFIARIVDTDEVDETKGYTDPKKLIEEIQVLTNHEKSKLAQLISETLNPEKMTYEQAVPYIEGLIKYLEYALQSKKLVRFNWS